MQESEKADVSTKSTMCIPMELTAPWGSAVNTPTHMGFPCAKNAEGKVPRALTAQDLGIHLCQGSIGQAALS